MIAWSLSIVLLIVVSSTVSYGIPQHRGLGSTCQTNDDCTRIPNSHCSSTKSCECLTGYHVDGSLTRCLKVANGYYDACEESVQCSGFLGAGGTCVNDRCVCPDRYHYLHGRCHETKGLNEPCSDDYECFVDADYVAASCVEGKCKCSGEFYQREYSTCRPKAEKIGDECLIDQDCDFDGSATCMSNKCSLGTEETVVFNYSVDRRDKRLSLSDENIIIGERKCEGNVDCKLLKYSICAANNTCVCDRGYFATRQNANEPDFKDGCVPEIGTNCDPEVEYEFNVTSATCKHNSWTCDIDKVAIKDNRLCRKVAVQIGKQCQYPEQCQLFGPRAECLDGKCQCDETSHWVEKEKFCWKTSKIGDVCEINNDCYSRGVGYSPTCESKVCTCPEDSNVSDDGGYCVSKEPELGFYCEKDEECQKIPNTSCENNECACAKTFFELDDQCVAGINATCKIDDDCKPDNTACYSIDATRKICQCAENFTLGPENSCIKKSQYQKECTYDVQCSATVKNTFCNGTRTEEEEEEEEDDDNEEDVTGSCECVADYYFNKDACYRKKYLGQECTRQGECFTNSSTSVCRNGICSCEFDFVQAGRECKPKNASPELQQIGLWILAMVAILTTAIP